MAERKVRIERAFEGESQTLALNVRIVTEKRLTSISVRWAERWA